MTDTEMYVKHLIISQSVEQKKQNGIYTILGLCGYSLRGATKSKNKKKPM